MGGLFAGFGRKAKSAETTAKPGTSTPAPADQAAATAANQSKQDGASPPGEHTSHESANTTDPTSVRLTPNDRSKTMRLSKTTSGKPEEDFDIPSDTVIPSFGSSSLNKSTTSEPRSAPPAAVVGAKITFKGELTGEEDLLIEGKIEGTIELKNHHLTIGKQGSVKANVVAKSISVEGTVEGDLMAVERISIKASSNVKGNVSAERVTLEDGAKFRGSIDMDSKSAINKATQKHSPSEQSTETV